jgi:hypothetical protein
MCWTQPYTRHKMKINNTKTHHYMCWTIWLCPTHIVVCFLYCLSSSCVLYMVVSNTYSGVFFVLFIFILCLVYGHNHIQDTRRRQTIQKTHHYMCWTQPYTRHKMKINNTKTHHYSCIWLCPTHIVVCFLYCLSSSCVLYMVVSNTYSGVFLYCLSSSCVLYMVVSNKINNTKTHHYMCWTQPYTRHKMKINNTKTHHYMYWTQPYTRHKMKINNTKNTPLYVVVSNTYSGVFLYCLSSSCVLYMVVSNTYSGVFLYPTIYKTQDEDKQYKKHTTICVGHNHIQDTR